MKFRINEKTTVADILEKIEEWHPTNSFYQVYVVAERKRSLKRYYQYAQLYKGHWCYKEILFRDYAKEIKEEAKQHVLRVDTEWAQHVSLGWRGVTGEGQHPVYLIHVKSISKKNLARSHKHGEELTPYAKEEMSGKRFQL